MPFAFIKYLRRPGTPVDPGYGVDEGEPGSPGTPDQGLPGYPVRPGHGLPRPPNVWPPKWPPSPVDPDWGVDGEVDNGLAPSLPIYTPIGPDHGLPPVAGHLPAPNPPPGTIWPPLPPGAPTGKAALLVYISGVGVRYIVVDIPATLPEEPGKQPK